MMTFVVDERILSSAIWLSDGSLSSVYLKNDANFPWFILVPRIKAVRELYELSTDAQHSLMTEITQWSTIITNYYQPTKLNVGMLGNIVAQLHIHIVARFTTDCAWPFGVWQATYPTICYEETALTTLVSFFSKY